MSFSLFCDLESKVKVAMAAKVKKKRMHKKINFVVHNYVIHSLFISNPFISNEGSNKILLSKSARKFHEPKQLEKINFTSKRVHI